MNRRPPHANYTVIAASNRDTMQFRRLCPLVAALALLIAPSLRAQSASAPDADRALRSAVQSELSAAQADHSVWMYHDHDVSPSKDALYDTVETPHGELRRLIELNGHPLSPSAAQAESQRILDYIHDPSEQARRRKAGAHDDAQATELLKMLPEAFIWTVASESNEFLTLNYRPNPKFDPPDMQARVMSIMAGQMIIARHDDRIRTLRGHLTQDVLFGWGILGRLYAGGTFDIERRQVGGGHWQITESHVHIGGHALIFKTIGQQDDEVKTDWKPSTDPNLEAAARTLGVLH